MEGFSLNLLVEQKYYENVKQAQTLLTRYKKQGIVFFDVDLEKIDYELLFEMYYARKKGTIKYRNAFPIPLPIYHFYSKNTIPYKILELFYYQYYKEKPNSSFLTANLQTFISKKHVWIYKTQNN